jgi:hypothetical protein
LCIKLDGKEDVTRQMVQMDKVYSCAALTIVGNRLSADSEIPGLCPSSGMLNQKVCKVGDIRLVNTRASSFGLVLGRQAMDVARKSFVEAAFNLHQISIGS